ncbi:MAG: FumA C-terminus/TtdB family hydratase beta subunit [Clostridiales bacterium]|jgi:fumarate hydratase subunit beta|nr:FumA C-terminus/TtdB family hydratase beta subunit [Clostridiales bacterium]
MKKLITTPIDDDTICSLRAGDEVLLTGKIYTARDAAHKRMFENGDEPFPFARAAVYYAGPSPAPPGRPTGSIGPTTSGRMDKYAPALMARGLKVMIGKGQRSPEVMAAIKRYSGLYLAAVGGAAALLSRSVLSSEVIAYPELGAESVRELFVENFPLITAADCHGGCIYALSGEPCEV